MIQRLLLTSLCLTLLAVVPATAQNTVDVNTNYWTATSPYAQTGAFFYSKLCNRTTGLCYSQPSNSLGFSTYVNIPSGSYDGYVWHQTPYDYGSQTVKIGIYSISSYTNLGLVAYPRPLAPVLKSCYGCSYPANTPFDLKWTNGLDAARTTANWTMTYDIYTATKPAGGSWGPELVTISDTSCNPDSNGYCVWHVDGLGYIAGGAEYHWRILARMHYYGETYTYTTFSTTTGDLFQSP